MQSGHIVHIFVAPEAAAEMIALEQVATLAGRGLQGDRYCINAGIFSKKYARHQSHATNATFIEAEAIAAVERENGITLDPRDTRRNILTQGIALHHLVGKEFRVGKVQFRGVELCQPCRYLETKAGSGKPNGMPIDGIHKGFIGRGGLRAEVLSDGIIYVGDEIVLEENQSNQAPHQ
jgi:MOSC domain-containing protein YiiM